MTKFCPNCGEENEDVAVFCRNCGHDLKELNDRIKNDDKFVSDKKSLSKDFPIVKVLVSIALIIVIGALIFSFMGSSTETVEDKNITLVKENAYGFTFVSEGVPYYDYYLKGVLKNLPDDDYYGYELRCSFFDSEGNFVYEDDSALMRDLFKYSDESYPTYLATYETTELVNMSRIELVLYDPDGDIIFNDSVKFDMAKMDLSGLNEK